MSLLPKIAGSLPIPGLQRRMDFTDEKLKLDLHESSFSRSGMRVGYGCCKQKCYR